MTHRLAHVLFCAWILWAQGGTTPTWRYVSTYAHHDPWTAQKDCEQEAKLHRPKVFQCFVAGLNPNQVEVYHESKP
jgi:hypothetical protein